MKKILLTLIAVVSVQVVIAQSLFQNIYGGKLSNNITFTASPDAYYLLHQDMFPNSIPKLIKIDLNGNIVWTKTLNYTASALGVFRVKYDNNSLFVTGGHQNSGYRNFLAKLDTAGNVLWTNELDYGDINISTRIHPLSNGYLTAGHRDYIGAHSIYTYDITLSRFDANGSLIWGKAYGDNSFDFLANSSVITPNGELIVAGSYGLRITNSYSPMLARFDTSGNLLWMKTFADTSGFFVSFQPTDITKTSDGNYALTGYSTNTFSNFDAHVIKIDDNGNILWAKRLYQINWQEYGKSILSDGNGALIVAGPYNLNTVYGDFFAEFDVAGNLLGTAIVSNTLDAPYILAQNSGVGEDIDERVGTGYVYSTLFKNGLNDYRHCLIASDYVGTLNCSALSGTYPFSVQDANWTFTNFTNLPVAETNISGTMVTFTTSTLADTLANICNLVGLEENTISDNIFSIYPNPANDEVTITALVSKNGTIKLSDIAGKEIKNYKFSTTLKIDLSQLTKGVYIMEVNADNKVFRKKLVKL